MKRLYKSNDGRMIDGVCAGLANYFGIDPVIIRLVLVLSCLADCGLSIAAYALAAIIIPCEPGDVKGSRRKIFFIALLIGIAFITIALPPLLLMGVFGGIADALGG